MGARFDALKNLVNDWSTPTAATGGNTNKTPPQDEGSGVKPAKWIADQHHQEQPISHYERLYDLMTQQKGNLPPEAESGVNLVMGDAATNANQMSGQRTLRNSRLADALNNRYYLGMGKSNIGTGRHGLIQASTPRERYRMPIETEEMRQMATIRNRDTALFGKRLDRQQNYLNRDLERNNAIFMEEMRRNGKYSDEELRRFGALFDSGLRRDETQFLQYMMRVSIPYTQAQLLLSIAGTNTTLAQILAPLFGGGVGPSAMNMLTNGLLQPLAAASTNGIGPDGLYQLYQQLAPQYRDLINQMLGRE